jgi:hydrogenase-4 membrane subunit HyfE
MMLCWGGNIMSGDMISSLHIVHTIACTGNLSVEKYMAKYLFIGIIVIAPRTIIVNVFLFRVLVC